MTYRQFICLECGWIYDEAQGIPGEGHAPGTFWEDLPEDFTCPDCGMPKDDAHMWQKLD